MRLVQRHIPFNKSTWTAGQVRVVRNHWVKKAHELWSYFTHRSKGALTSFRASCSCEQGFCTPFVRLASLLQPWIDLAVGRGGVEADDARSVQKLVSLAAH